MLTLRVLGTAEINCGELLTLPLLFVAHGNEVCDFVTLQDVI